MNIKCQHPTFGFELFTCGHRHRVAVAKIVRGTTASKIRDANRRYTGAFITDINGIPVFSEKDALAAFAAARADPKLDKLIVTFSPEKQPLAKDLVEPFLFGIDMLRRINSLITTRHETGTLPDLTDQDLDLLIATIQNNLCATPPTPEELSAGNLTRRKLKKLATWPKWFAAEGKQLDEMARQNMYGAPCIPPAGAIILRQHWRYIFKEDGSKKARNCCDGSLKAAPQLHAAEQTYSSCVEHPSMRLFYALCSYLGMLIWYLDAVNAYANAKGPTIQTYVYVDDAYTEWYYKTHGRHIDRRCVLPVLGALQGHPESGALWERACNAILHELGFKSTTHERNLFMPLSTATLSFFVDRLMILPSLVRIQPRPSSS
jgi:hypothetical protein